MAREGVHVRHARIVRFAAAAVPHTPLPSAMRTQAGLPWNGPDDQLASLQEIEAAPSSASGRASKMQRRRIGGVGDQIVLAGEQAASSARQLRVVGGLVAKS